jgi:hypothetical protein
MNKLLEAALPRTNLKQTLVRKEALTASLMAGDFGPIVFKTKRL